MVDNKIVQLGKEFEFKSNRPACSNETELALYIADKPLPDKDPGRTL
jgi:hypothetical protein